MTRHLCFPKIPTNFDSSDHRTVSCFASVHFKANERRSGNGSIAGSCSHTASLQWQSFNLHLWMARCSQEVIFHAVIYITESLLFITLCCQAASRLIFDIIPMAQQFLQILWVFWWYLNADDYIFILDNFLLLNVILKLFHILKMQPFFFFTDLPIFTSEKLSLRCSRANHVTDLLPINLISCIMFLQLFLLFVALILWGLFFLTCCWHQNQNELIFIMK